MCIKGGSFLLLCQSGYESGLGVGRELRFKSTIASPRVAKNKAIRNCEGTL